MHQARQDREFGFTLIELLVVVIVLGILASVAIPRFLRQRVAAYDSAAVSDLRNLMTTETSLEASTGLTEDAGEIAAEGWEVSYPEVFVCADLIGTDDLALAAWHERGSRVYSWQRSSGTVTATEIDPLPLNCGEAMGGTPTPVS